MKITAKQYAKSLFETIRDADKTQAKKAIQKFSKILVDNNKTSEVNKILSYFDYLWNKEKNVIDAEVITVNKMNKSDITLLKDYITKETGADEVNLIESIDEKIMGGFVVKYDDKIFDVSIKNRMRELGKALRK